MSTDYESMQPALEVEGMPEPSHERFNPDQRRAFGSVPTLLGAKLEIPRFERLSGTALERISAESLHVGLFGADNHGVAGRNAVDGLVLNTAEYTVIVRNPESFQSAIQAKTLAARKASNDVRLQEKELKSGYESFRQKWDRQNKVLKGFHRERQTVATLLEWQAVPGYSRTSEIDIVGLANEALNGTIHNMLKTCKDQYQLSPEDHVEMVNALSYRLFRGPQKERVANWGSTLRVAQNYTDAKINLFQNRQNRVVEFGSRLRSDLDNFYQKHDLLQTA